jgi:hypothetical protein
MSAIPTIGNRLGSVLQNGALFTASGSVTAIGSSQATAYQLVDGVNNVTSVAGSTGVNLPPAVLGAVCIVYNASGTTLSVYGYTTTDTIKGSTSAYSIATVRGVVFVCVAAGTWAGIYGA